MAKAKKQAESERNQREVRLNRALEDIDKYKQALRDAKLSGEKPIDDQEKKELEKAVNENKKLEKQRTDLIIILKKQQKLIDILKRQKIHLEAAKKLAIAEEELDRLFQIK